MSFANITVKIQSQEIDPARVRLYDVVSAINGRPIRPAMVVHHARAMWAPTSVTLEDLEDGRLTYHELGVLDTIGLSPIHRDLNDNR